MSLIEEVMRRSARERAAVPAATGGPTVAYPAAGPASTYPAGPAGAAPLSQHAPHARIARPVHPPAHEGVPSTYRQAQIDPQALERNHVLLRVADIGISRAYKLLRTRVLHRLSANDWYTLGITGTAAGEGKTLTAVNLALALAQDVNTSVFLVDLDLQRPQIGAYLGMRYEYGLTDYLTGQADLEQIIYEIGVKRLAVVPNASAVENSSELLRSPRMSEFVSALEAQVPRRILVLDMPPIMVTDDVLAFAHRVDSFLLVVSQGHTARRILDNAKEVLSELNLMGVVLNRSTERNDSPYY